MISVAFSPDGSRIVSGDSSGNVIVWDAGALTRLHTASSGAASVYSVASFPDGSQIVSGDYRGNVIVWDAGTLTPLHTASSGAAVVTVQLGVLSRWQPDQASASCSARLRLPSRPTPRRSPLATR